ncbi:hypothetical protein MRX96_020724 [Rhipicephalus microplus]
MVQWRVESLPTSALRRFYPVLHLADHPRSRGVGVRWSQHFVTGCRSTFRQPRGEKPSSHPHWVSDRKCRAQTQLRRLPFKIRIMILPQVHLRKPRYDVYFFQIIKFGYLSNRPAQPKGHAGQRSGGLTKSFNR